MKKLTKILAMTLALVLVVSLLGACAKKDAAPKPDAQPAETPAQTPAETPGTPPAEAPEAPEEQEIAEIVMIYPDINGHGEDGQRITDAINAIVEPKLGVRVKMEYFGYGDLITKMPMMLAGNETIDVMPLCGQNFQSLISQGQLVDITELVPQYAPDAANVLGSYLDGCVVDGKLYGLPTYRIYATNDYLVFRQDILDELGLTEQARTLSSWSETEALYAAIDAQYHEIPLVGGMNVVLDAPSFTWSGDNFSTFQVQDNLGDLNNMIDVIDGKVVNAWEKEGTLTNMQRVADWAARGWVWSDTAISTDPPDTLFKQGAYLSYPQPSEVGVEVAKKGASGYDVVCPMIAPGVIKTFTLQCLGLAVPATAQEPEAALRFINELYVNADLMNLLIWGIEGEDYVVNAEGEACYPAGTDGNVKWHQQDYTIGSQFIILPWEGQGGDFRAVSEASNEAALKSAYLGFTLDTTGLDVQIAALSSVRAEYRPTLCSGGYTPELFAEFLAKLEAADLAGYMAEAQRQIDAWSAAKG